MKKRIFKRILVFASVICLVMACVPAVSLAVDPVSGAMALAGAIDAYGMAYGVGTVYDVSSSSGVTSSFEGLWDDFSEYQSNAGSQFDYDSFIDDYNQNRSLYGFEHSSGKFAAWSIDAESAEIFDQFWNWLLTGPAEMVRVDNEYFEFSQAQIGDNSFPINVFSQNSLFINQPLPVTSAAASEQSKFLSSFIVTGTYLFGGVPSVSGVVANQSDVYCFVVPPQTIYVVSLSSSMRAWDTRREGDSYYAATNFGNSPTFDVVDNFYYYWLSFPDTNIVSNNLYLPSFPSLDDGARAYSALLSGDSSSDHIGVKAYGNGYVTVPDPSLPDYEPTPLEIVTNIPWDSAYDDTDEEDGSPVPFPPVDVPIVVDDILTSISAEDYSLEEDPQDPDPDPPPPAPSEVFVPLLPVGLPSFNFSFSGIWHYVREWVSSLGAWFTTLFTIWSALPYAMVVPVYATAVVVIVLGVYKRFFM